MSTDALVKVLEDKRIRTPKEMLIMLVMAEMSGGDGVADICSAPAYKVARQCRMREMDVELVQRQLVKRGLLARTVPDARVQGFIIRGEGE